MNKWLKSLSQHFDPAVFKKARDQTFLQKVCNALTPTFIQQFDFIYWFMEHLDRIHKLAGRCWCHRASWGLGQDATQAP